MGYRKFSKPLAERRALLIKLGLAGASLDQIVEATDYSRTTVEHELKRLGLRYDGLRALGDRPPIPRHLVPTWNYLRRVKLLSAKKAAQAMKKELDMAREPGSGTIHA